LCANLANLAPAGTACDCGPVAIGVVGMSAGHGPPPAACSYSAAPSLSVEHGPLRAARGRGLAIAAAPSLSAGHGPLRATRDHGPAIAAGLQWTCGSDSSAGG
jgi:hypothetical protein